MALIVVAVDFSPASQRALDAACELADDLEASIVLVHAFAPRMTLGLDPGHPDPVTAMQLEIDMDEAIELSTKWAGQARKRGLEVETVARPGKVHAVVMEEARKRKASLIVVGSHGRTGVKRAVLGSVAESILRHADRPVVVVPAA